MTKDRKAPLGSFKTFPKEIVRTTKELLKKGKKLLKVKKFNTGGRAGFKHGDFIEGDPNPHVDTYKYKDRTTGKITSHKVEGSEMKSSQKKQQAGRGQQARRKSKKIKPTIIKLDVGKDGKNIFKVVESKAKGGRAAFRGGGRTNLLEELGRVEGESSNRNRRAEVSRIHGELNKGYSLGGRVGAAKRGFNKKILRKD